MYGKTRSKRVLGNYSCLRCMSKKCPSFTFFFYELDLCSLTSHCLKLDVREAPNNFAPIWRCDHNKSICVKIAIYNCQTSVKLEIICSFFAFVEAIEDRKHQLRYYVCPIAFDHAFVSHEFLHL